MVFIGNEGLPPLTGQGCLYHQRGVVFNNLHPVGPGALCPLTGLHEGDGDICRGWSSSLALGGDAQAQTDHLGRSSLFGRDVVIICRGGSPSLTSERGHMLKYTNWGKTWLLLLWVKTIRMDFRQKGDNFIFDFDLTSSKSCLNLG